MLWFRRKKEPEEYEVSAQDLTCPGCPKPCGKRGPRGKMGPMGPQGPTGATGTCLCQCRAPELLSSYSTPPQSGGNGTVLVFDRNAVSNGTSVIHAQNSGTFTIQQTGFYQVSFHGTLAPTSGSSCPLTVSLSLQQQGDQVPGTAVQQTFHTSTDLENIAFSQIIQVKTVPTTLQVTGQGKGYFYGPVSMFISKLDS